MGKKPKGILMYLTDLLAIENLSITERGQLLTAILEYGNHREIEQSLLQGGAYYIWPMFQSRMDAQFEKYAETCERNRKNRTSRNESSPMVDK